MPAFLSIHEYSDKYKVPRSTVYHRIRTGKLKVHYKKRMVPRMMTIPCIKCEELSEV